MARPCCAGVGVRCARRNVGIVCCCVPASPTASRDGHRLAARGSRHSRTLPFRQHQDRQWRQDGFHQKPGRRMLHLTEGRIQNLFHDPPVIHHETARGEASHEPQIMGHEQVGNAVLGFGRASSAKAEACRCMSRLDTASSRMTSFGPTANARAMQTRCNWPPLTWEGNMLGDPGRQLDHVQQFPHAGFTPGLIQRVRCRSGSETMARTVKRAFTAPERVLEHELNLSPEAGELPLVESRRGLPEAAPPRRSAAPARREGVPACSCRSRYARGGDGFSFRDLRARPRPAPILPALAPTSE